MAFYGIHRVTDILSSTIEQNGIIGERPCQLLFVLAITAATRCTDEHLGFLRSGRKSCDRNCCGGYQYSMPHHAPGKERVASNRKRETNRPHQSQRLQNIMPDGDVGNITKRTDFVIKDKISSIHDKVPGAFEHGSGPF